MTGHGEFAALKEELREEKHRNASRALNVAECKVVLSVLCEVKRPTEATRSAIGKILNHMRELETGT